MNKYITVGVQPNTKNTLDIIMFVYAFPSLPAVKLPEKNTADEVHLFMQYYIDSSDARQKEIRACLTNNLQNPYIRKVHMLNERIYTNKEIGVKSAKINQTVIGRRLSYSDIFEYINDNDIQGYIIIANSDILFDLTLENLLYSDIHLSKKMFAQLRYELNPSNPSASAIFGPRYDSQDVWILHTNYGITPEQQQLFQFHMGIPGCDNHLVHLFTILGYEVINHPAFIQTVHYHTTQKRNYDPANQMVATYGLVIPYGYSMGQCVNSIGRLNTEYSNISQMPQLSDNTILHDYILSKFAENKPFIVPRIGVYETEFARIGDIWYKTQNATPETRDFVQRRITILQQNTGILVKTAPHIMEYSQTYLRAFSNCELYAGWEKHGGAYKHIKESHDYVVSQAAHNKTQIWTKAFDIFHYIYGTPWTHALKGKRILIVSSFAETIRKQIAVRQNLYDGVDLFPDCSFVFIQPPQTHGAIPSTPDDTDYYGVYLAKFTTQLNEIKDTYDVALVACGGYGNPVCNHIFESSGKTAINVGGVLQMYFGVAGNRWYRNSPEIIQLFLNEHWTRPSPEERPAGAETIENACYW